MGKGERDPGGLLGRALPSPGVAYAAERLARSAFPKVTVTPPAPGIRRRYMQAGVSGCEVQIPLSQARPPRQSLSWMHAAPASARATQVDDVGLQVA